MNRRSFLSLIAPAAALIVAPELLLPKRTFFLPPAGGWGRSTLTVADLQRAKALLRQAEMAAYPPVIYELGNEAWMGASLEIERHWSRIGVMMENNPAVFDVAMAAWKATPLDYLEPGSINYGPRLLPLKL